MRSGYLFAYTQFEYFTKVVYIYRMFTKAETTALTESLEKLAADNGEPKPKTRDYRQKWLQKMQFLNSIASHDNAIILLHDTTENRFLYMSDKGNILGNYHPE